MTAIRSPRIQWAYFCLSHLLETQIQFFLLITGQPIYQAEYGLPSPSHSKEYCLCAYWSYSSTTTTTERTKTWHQISSIIRSQWRHFCFRRPNATLRNYEGWNFNFGNTPLDWIQVLLEWRANAAGRMGPSPTYIHNRSSPSWNGHTQ